MDQPRARIIFHHAYALWNQRRSYQPPYRGSARLGCDIAADLGAAGRCAKSWRGGSPRLIFSHRAGLAAAYFRYARISLIVRRILRLLIGVVLGSGVLVGGIWVLI